jgi:hypothetical protein
MVSFLSFFCCLNQIFKTSLQNSKRYYLCIGSDSVVDECGIGGGRRHPCNHASLGRNRNLLRNGSQTNRKGKKFSLSFSFSGVCFLLLCFELHSLFLSKSLSPFFTASNQFQKKKHSFPNSNRAKRLVVPIFFFHFSFGKNTPSSPPKFKSSRAISPSRSCLLLSQSSLATAKPHPPLPNLN